MKKQKILITGGSSLLALNWIISVKDRYDIIITLHKQEVQLDGVQTLFLSLDSKESIEAVLKQYSPTFVIHTTALTDIEECEKDPELARKVNVELAINVASACNYCKVRLAHISTDHLFSGYGEFHKETNKPSPLNVYAKTKLDAENEVLKAYSKALIIRTNFFGWGPSYRHSLTDKIIYALRNGDSIILFDDVFFTPILASELANNVHRLLDLGESGIINIVGNERLSKYEFGLKVAYIFGLNSDLIKKSSIEDNSNLTLRPKDMSLSNHRFVKIFERSIKSLDEQLTDLRDQENVPNNDEIIPYGKHHIDEEDIKSVVDVLRSESLTQGNQIIKFEQAIADYVGAKYAIAVSSGTAALHLSALVAGVGPENALVTSPITFVASANSALYAGGRGIFADIDPPTINIAPENLKQVIEDNPDVRAVVPVHFAGLPCDMPAIKLVADQVDAVVIEDAAHALGAKYPDGRQVGCCAHSHMTIFSFHPVKAIATGEGGMITTNDERVYRKLLRLRSHGINKFDDPLLLPEQSEEDGALVPWYYEMQELGFNYRITDIQSALGLSQLSKIQKFIARRRELVMRYDEELSGMCNCIPAQNTGSKHSSHHLYVIRIDFEKIGLSRRRFMKALKDSKIASQIHYIPIPMHPYYQQMGFKIEDYPNAKKYYQEALTIPLYYELTDDQQSMIISKIKSITISDFDK